MSIDDIINMTVDACKDNSELTFEFPKFNQFWNKGWEKFF